MPSKITRAVLRDDTILRLGGNGDNWFTTWASDDTQLTAMCDGSGWPETPVRYFNTRLYRIIGDDPASARFEPLPGYPPLTNDPFAAGGVTRYYGLGTLAIGERVYQFLSTYNKPVNPFGVPEEFPDDLRLVGVKLIYSPDGGATWHNQDGSTPVTWDAWEGRSRETMLFFEEPQDAFSQIAVLQMGKGYEANEDGYVYLYSQNGNTEGTMNQLVMCRVPKDRVLDRGAYEYFAAIDGDGAASWTSDIEQRGVVHTFPSGWVNRTGHPWAWHPDVVYNAPLGVYMMASFGMGCSPDLHWFGKPSYLGLWTAPQPWGPWTQVCEEVAWTPGGDAAARNYRPGVLPKWISEDGRSFWLVWSDAQSSRGIDQLHEEAARLRETASSAEEFLEQRLGLMPYYAFNTQRVDLVVADDEADDPS